MIKADILFTKVRINTEKEAKDDVRGSGKIFADGKGVG